MSSVHFKVDDTLGAAFIGLAASCMAFGVFVTQVYRYFHRYSSDRLAYKYIVLVLLIVGTIDQSFICYTVYFYVITNYDSPLALIVGSVIWSLLLQMLLGAIAGTTVKVCFALRVYRFSNRNKPLTFTLLFLTFTGLAFSITYTVKAFALEKLVYLDRLALLATITLGMGVLTDFATAASLCYYLRKLKTGYSKCDSLVNRLTLYAINTGLLTTFVSLCTVVLYNVMPHNFVFVGFYFVLSKCFGISFMATLNTRECIKGKGVDEEQQQPPTHEINAFSSTKPFTPSFAEHNQTESQFEVGLYHETFFSNEGQEDFRDTASTPWVKVEVGKAI